MTTTAPTCPTSRNQPRGMPLPFGLAQQVAAIPRAHDLKSAITALNMMETIIQQITYTPPVINNIGQKPDYGAMYPGYPLGPFQLFEASNWHEKSRDYSPYGSDLSRVYNTDDLEQFVDFKTLGFVLFEDKMGHTLEYKRD
jgi:hypothetical protein